jgi:hypothetical protein
MRLRLRFTGMHLFVPKPDEGMDPRVHVVMPMSHGHHVADQHIPLFAVKAGYLTQGSDEEGEGWYIYPLRGLVLAIGEGDDVVTGICPEIVDLRRVTPLPVVEDVLGPNGSGKAVARVDLRAGRMSRVVRGACWYWASSTPEPYTNSAEWEIHWPEASVTLKLQDWDGNDAATLPKLHPLNGTDVVDVCILHLPAPALPTEEVDDLPPPVMSEVPHFGCYFALLDGVGPEGRPRFAAVPDTCGSHPSACPVIPEAAASPYNCMLATISPEE